MHNIQRLSHENAHELCQRRFVIGTYSCPDQIGNRIHEFLNAIAGAIITNRTILWHFCNEPRCSQRTSELKCNECLIRNQWISSKFEVFNLLKYFHCPIIEKDEIYKVVYPGNNTVVVVICLLDCLLKT